MPPSATALTSKPSRCRSDAAIAARGPLSHTVTTGFERSSAPQPSLRSNRYGMLRELGCGALERSKPVVTVCESGPRAAIAASLLQREGFDVSAVWNGGVADFGGEVVSFRRCGS